MPDPVSSSQHPAQSHGNPPSPSSICCIISEHLITSAHLEHVRWLPVAPMRHTAEHWVGKASGDGGGDDCRGRFPKARSNGKNCGGTAVP